MDIASKIKMMKEEAQRLDDERTVVENRIKELKSLIELKKLKEAKLEEAKKIEAELLALV